MDVISLEPWNQVSYARALEEQQKLTEQGRLGWLLFCCPATITCGKRALSSDVLLSREALRRLGIELLEVDRGGQVTFHGPGQIIGFPFGRLEEHTGDTRGVRAFVSQVREALESVAGLYHPIEPCRDESNVGVWTKQRDVVGKVASLGMAFGRDGIRHGFALNVTGEVARGFELIHPCGMPGVRIHSLLGGRSVLEEEFLKVKQELSRALARQGTRHHAQPARSGDLPGAVARHDLDNA